MTDAQVRLGALASVPDRIALLARADVEVLELVPSVLAQLWLGHPGVAEEHRIRFETALTEVLGNIVEHAYRADAAHPAVGERRFQLVVGVARRDPGSDLGSDPGSDPGSDLVAVLGDNGLPAALDLSEVVMPGAEAESGRGLPLAQAALDQLEYERVGDCNQWLLVKHLPVT